MAKKFIGGRRGIRAFCECIDSPLTHLNRFSEESSPPLVKGLIFLPSN